CIFVIHEHDQCAIFQGRQTGLPLLIPARIWHTVGIPSAAIIRVGADRPVARTTAHAEMMKLACCGPEQDRLPGNEF
ncbi:MAG: hypothetical protein K8R91_06365, partial [Phycisphaerae bacterium]|nr:hypothetical protein [Phycisphaerae bacterium]